MNFNTLRARGFEAVRIDLQVHPYEMTQLPTRGTEKSGGYDFYLKEDVTIFPNTQVRTWFDVKAYMKDDEVLKMYTRSSVGSKLNIMFSNQTGIIDSDFYENPENDGNISAFLYNYGNEVIELKKGERVAQGLFVKYLTTDDDKPLKKSRTGGTGSTGK